MISRKFKRLPRYNLRLIKIKKYLCKGEILIMAALGFSEKIAENTKDLGPKENMLGVTLRQPFSNTNAGVIIAQRIQ